jgi:hypothetical protein
MNDCPAEDEIAFMLIIPHTTTVRRIRWEFVCVKSFLKRGVFHLQQIRSVSLKQLEAELGALTSDEPRALRETVSGHHYVSTYKRHFVSDSNRYKSAVCFSPSLRKSAIFGGELGAGRLPEACF